MLWLRRWIPKRNLGWFWFARAGRHFNRNRCSWYRSTFMQFAPYSIFNLYFPSEIISPVRVCLCWCLTTRLTLRCRCVRWPATQRAQKADRYGHPWPPPPPHTLSIPTLALMERCQGWQSAHSSPSNEEGISRWKGFVFRWIYGRAFVIDIYGKVPRPQILPGASATSGVIRLCIISTFYLLRFLSLCLFFFILYFDSLSLKLHSFSLFLSFLAFLHFIRTQSSSVLVPL